MNLEMLQSIYQRVQEKKLFVEDTTSTDCKSLEPNDGNGNGYLICKSYTAKNDYLWKIVELDEWKMFKNETEKYYEKGGEEYNEIENIYQLVTQKQQHPLTVVLQDGKARDLSERKVNKQN